MNRTAALALAALVAACGQEKQKPQDPFVAATPDVAGIALETTGGAGDGLALTAEGGLAVRPAVAPCQPYMYLCNIQQGVRGLNEYVRAIVGSVEQMTKLPYAEPVTGVRVYGPADLPAGAPVGTFQLTVQRLDLVGPDVYRWKLEAKRVGAGTFQVVLAGQLRTGALAHRGRGFLGIDLDALAAALNPPGGAPVWVGAGKILVGFSHVGGAKSVAYLLKGFDPDVTDAAPPVDAAFVGHRLADGRTRVRVVAVADMVVPAGQVTGQTASELLLSRAGWLPLRGGRAAVVVAGGDVPGAPDSFLLGVSCFNVAQQEVYRDLFTCSAATGCAQYLPGAPVLDGTWRTGQPGLCALGTALYDDQDPPPATDPLATTPEPEAPAVPEAPPATVPVF
jgi:hypothetical protein